MLNELRNNPHSLALTQHNRARDRDREREVELSDPYGPRLDSPKNVWHGVGVLHYSGYLRYVFAGMGCTLCYGHCGYDTITNIIRNLCDGEMGAAGARGFYVSKQHVVAPFRAPQSPM